MNIQKYIDVLSHLQIAWKQNERIAEYTSLKIGGPAALVVKPSNDEQLHLAFQEAKRLQLPVCMIGNGSNILADDCGYDGVLIVTPPFFHSIERREGNVIYAQAGASLRDVCLFARDESLGGMEFAYGIPATVGGAVYMNAGAYGGEIKDILLSCRFLDEHGEWHVKHVSDLQFSYRQSLFTDREVCVADALFQLYPDDKKKIAAKMEELMEKRRQKQPLEYASAGSTFKRPQGNYASALIEQCGLKGYRIGDAMVSDKHAGFLINMNQATSHDFKQLIHYVQEEVYQQTGYHLECEVKMIP